MQLTIFRCVFGECLTTKKKKGYCKAHENLIEFYKDYSGKISKNSVNTITQAHIRKRKSNNEQSGKDNLYISEINTVCCVLGVLCICFTTL